MAETSSIQPLAVLKSAATGAVNAVAAWNRSGGVPAKDGFSRPLPTPKTVRFTADLLKLQPHRLAGGALLVPPSGGVVWGRRCGIRFPADPGLERVRGLQLIVGKPQADSKLERFIANSTNRCCAD